MCYDPGLTRASGFKRATILSPSLSMVSLFPALPALFPRPIAPRIHGLEGQRQSRLRPTSLLLRRAHAHRGWAPPSRGQGRPAAFQKVVRSRWGLTASSGGSWLHCLLAPRQERGWDSGHHPRPPQRTLLVPVTQSKARL